MPSLDTYLKQTSLEELQAFVRQYAKRDKDFKISFEIHFAAKVADPSIEKKYQRLLKGLISRRFDRGYIHYREANTLSNEIGRLLDDVDHLVHQQNFRDAFLVSKAILSETLEALADCDDSSGRMSDVLYGAIAALDNISWAEGIAPPLQEAIFDFLHNELSNTLYFSFGDFGSELFDLYRRLAVYLGKKTLFMTFVDRELAALDGDSDAWTSSYRREFYLMQKIEFLEENGEHDAANHLTFQNLRIFHLRQVVVDRAFDKGDIEQARELINAGIVVARQENAPGHITHWEQTLIRVAEYEQDVQTIRRECKRFAFFRGFSIGYYRRFKATYSSVEWKEEVERLILERTAAVRETFRNVAHFSGKVPLLEALSPIFVEEQMWDRLMDEVKDETRLDTILTYHEYLVERYPDQMLQAYLRAIEGAARHCSNRSAYRNLTSTMKKIRQDLPSGASSIDELALLLKSRYQRRPAMVDELEKFLQQMGTSSI